VPIAFAFEPAICGKKPTHVFNPCGHAASEEVHRYLSCGYGGLLYALSFCRCASTGRAWVSWGYLHLTMELKPAARFV
jgi:hypothetical protein